MKAFSKSLNLPTGQKQLTLLDAISLDCIVNTSKVSSKSDLPRYMLRRIMLLDTSSRKLPDICDKDKPQKEVSCNSLSSFLDEEEKEEDLVHPMDVFLYLFSIATPIFRQTLVNQVAKCQLSLPLISYDSENEQTTFNHFSFQTLILNRYVAGEETKCFSALEEPLPIVSFIRVGECENSQKSEIMNRILNVRHEYFFHYNCADSTKKRFLLNGTVEIAWYLPKYKENINIDNHFILLNLRGDASSFPKQCKFIGDISTLVYVFVPISKITPDLSQKLMDFHETFKSKVLFLVYKTGTEKSPNPKIIPNVLRDENCTIFLLKKNISQDSKIISDSISHCLHGINTPPVSLLKCISVATLTGILCDFQTDKIGEKQTLVDSICKDIPLCLPKDKDKNIPLAEVKDQLLPLQGFFRIWADSNRDLQLMNSEGRQNIEEYMNRAKKKKSEARLSQMQALLKPSRLLCGIINQCQYYSTNNDTNEIYLFWDLLRNKLNDISRIFLPLLYNQYKEWMVKSYSLHTDTEDLSERNAKQEEAKRNLFKTAEYITRSSLGIEHIFRELGQVYEAFLSSNDPKLKTSVKHKFKFSPTLLAGTAAHLILQGNSFEIVNGDDNHVPITWVSDVLTQLSEIVGADKKIFVVSVLGIQSSGKSTLLNTMFGIDFPVSSGRCTRGVFMQMIPITDELRPQLGYDYLLLLDTEGLRAPELSDSLSYKRDNEMATFTVGLGDLALINIKGESHSEVQDILQITVIAFMRMKLTFSKPKCIFVHQNVGDIQAKTNLMIARRNLIDTLNEMTLCAAQQENKEIQFSQFCDVIEFNPEEDVFYFPGLFEGEPPMTSIAPGYIEKAQELRSRIITSMSLGNRNFLTLKEWRKKLLGLWNSVLKENFVFSYRNILEVNARIELDNALCNWHSNFSQEMAIIKSEFVNRLYNVESEHLQDTMEQIQKDLYQSMCSTSSHIYQIMNYFFIQHEKKAVFEQWKFRTEQFFEICKANAIKQITNDCEILCKVEKQKQDLNKSFVICRKEIVSRVRNLYDTTNHLSFDFPESIDDLFNNFWKEWKSAIQVIPVEHIDISIDLQKVLFESLQLKQLDVYTERRNHFMDKDKFKLVGMGEFDEIFRMFSLSQDEYHYYKVIDYQRGNFSFGRFFSLFNPNRKTEKNESKAHQHRLQSIIDEHTGIIDNIIAKFPPNSNYNIDYFSILIDNCVNLITEHNKSEKVSHAHQSFILTNHFIFDFVFYQCCRAIRCFEILQENYLAQSSLELKLEELESILRENFSQLCTGIRSEKVCAEQLSDIILNGMKEYLRDKVLQILQNLFISDPEHGTTYCSRASLQLSILKHLARKKDFASYISYINSPFSYINAFVKERILNYSQNPVVISNILVNITISIHELKRNCISAAVSALSQSRNSWNEWDEWKQHFHNSILKYVRGVKLSELEILDVYNVNNFQQFSELFAQSLGEAIEHFDLNSWVQEILTPHQCYALQENIANTLVECKALCPFCHEPCQLSAGEHEHYCGTFHRPQGVSGAHYLKTDEIVIEECTRSILNDYQFLHDKKWYTYVNYRSVNEYFNSWRILGEDSIDSKYWQWVLCTFQREFVEFYEILANNSICIEWSDLTEEEVIDDLERHYQNYIFKTIK